VAERLRVVPEVVTGLGVEFLRDEAERSHALYQRHRKAATVDFPESPVTVNAVSRNDDRFHTITETTRLLGYEPRDNAAEVLDE